VKLLFDQNLSPRLANRLADIFPGSSHVFLPGLGQAEDTEVWRYARDKGFVIVTKDADFGERSTLHGFPPQLAWYRCSTLSPAWLTKAPPSITRPGFRLFIALF
jgi:predicted nuclease of predicted toxin-antitoxin system